MTKERGAWVIVSELVMDERSDRLSNLGDK